MGSLVVFSFLDQAVWVQALAGDIPLCSLERPFGLTGPISTQVYKSVLSNFMLWVTLR